MIDIQISEDVLGLATPPQSPDKSPPPSTHHQTTTPHTLTANTDINSLSESTCNITTSPSPPVTTRGMCVCVCAHCVYNMYACTASLWYQSMMTFIGVQYICMHNLLNQAFPVSSLSWYFYTLIFFLCIYVALHVLKSGEVVCLQVPMVNSTSGLTTCTSNKV